MYHIPQARTNPHSHVDFLNLIIDIYYIYIYVCDAARQNQALFARFRSAAELSLQAYPQKVENEFPTESVS